MSIAASASHIDICIVKLRHVLDMRIDFALVDRAVRHRARERAVRRIERIACRKVRELIVVQKRAVRAVALLQRDGVGNAARARVRRDVRVGIRRAFERVVRVLDVRLRRAAEVHRQTSDIVFGFSAGLLDKRRAIVGLASGGDVEVEISRIERALVDLARPNSRVGDHLVVGILESRLDVRILHAVRVLAGIALRRRAVLAHIGSREHRRIERRMLIVEQGLHLRPHIRAFVVRLERVTPGARRRHALVHSRCAVVGLPCIVEVHIDLARLDDAFALELRHDRIVLVHEVVVVLVSIRGNLELVSHDMLVGLDILIIILPDDVTAIAIGAAKFLRREVVQEDDGRTGKLLALAVRHILRTVIDLLMLRIHERRLELPLRNLAMQRLRHGDIAVGRRRQCSEIVVIRSVRPQDGLHLEGEVVRRLRRAADDEGVAVLVHIGMFVPEFADALIRFLRRMEEIQLLSIAKIQFQLAELIVIPGSHRTVEHLALHAEIHFEVRTVRNERRDLARARARRRILEDVVAVRDRRLKVGLVADGILRGLSGNLRRAVRPVVGIRRFLGVRSRTLIICADDIRIRAERQCHILAHIRRDAAVALVLELPGIDV